MPSFEIPLVHLELGAWTGYFLCVVGLWSLCGRLYPLLRFCLCQRSPTLRGRYGAGSWALVTGATSALGAQFAATLAEAGYNVALIAKSEVELQSLAQQLQLKYSVQTRTVCVEVASRGPGVESFYTELWGRLQGLDVGIVVNLFGKLEDDFFRSQSPELQAQVLNTTTWPVVALTRWALSHMAQRTCRSAVVNVSSIVSLYPYAGMALSSAAMKFSDFLLQSIAGEIQLDPALRGKVDVLSVRPSVVQTERSDRRSHTAPKECVEGAFRSLGRAKYTAGAWKHSFLTAFLSVMPEAMKESAMVKHLRAREARKQQ